MRKPITVLIVEDHFLARIALRGLLETLQEFAIVAETNSGSEAIRLYREKKPDVVIMDLHLKDLSGFHAIEAIHRECPSARILVLSNLSGIEDISTAMRAGARGYLTKDSDGPQLAHALRTVAVGARFVPKHLESQLLHRLPDSGITPREKEVLQLIAEGLSTADIAARIEVAEKTVRIHISNVLEKLGARDRTQALVMALKQGIIHLDEEG